MTTQLKNKTGRVSLVGLLLLVSLVTITVVCADVQTPTDETIPMGLYGGEMIVFDPQGNIKSITPSQNISDIITSEV